MLAPSLKEREARTKGYSGRNRSRAVAELEAARQSRNTTLRRELLILSAPL